jgi:argininosuccinate lyase
VALDFRSGSSRNSTRTDAALTRLIAAFLDKAEQHAETVMPGFTHLQSAQPVTFGHHLHGLCRDVRPRPLAGSAMPSKRMNESPLGAAALAGTGFPIDRDHDRQGAWL